MPWDNKIKRRLKLKDLDVFMAVAALGGMGKASARLNLSQPAISKAIADLEQTLGSASSTALVTGLNQPSTGPHL